MISTISIWMALASALTAGKLVEEKRGDVVLLSDLDDADQDHVFSIVADTEAGAVELLESMGIRKRNRHKTKLRIYSHESDYEDYKRRTRDLRTDISSHSYYDDQRREVVLSWNKGHTRSTAQLQRQMAKHILQQFSQNPPIWFEEGFAGYFEGIQTDPFGDTMDDVNTGLLDTMLRAIASKDYCPLFELMDLQHNDFYGLAGAKNLPWTRNLLYAESWAILLYLLKTTDEDDRKLFDMVANRVSSGRWNQSAFKRGLADMEPRWIAFLKDGNFKDQGAQVRSAWKALQRNDPQSALRSANAALAINNGQTSARRALSRAAYSLEDYESAKKQFGLLAEKLPDDFDVHLSLALSCLRLAQRTTDPVDIDDAVKRGKAAATLAPPDRVYEALVVAADGYELKGDVKGALKMVRQAMKSKGTPREARSELREREQRLIKQAIGKSTG